MLSNGEGKFVICSSIITTTQGLCRLREARRSRDSLAYFYCCTFDINEARPVSSAHDFSKFARTVITQLCPPNYVFPVLHTLYHRCVQKHPERRPSNNEFEETLLSIFEQLSPTKRVEVVQRMSGLENPLSKMAPGETFLIIDGLDQIPIGRTRDNYLLFIKRLVDRKLANLHILISSRDHPGIRKSLNSYAKWIMIPLDRHGMKEDVRLFVRKTIQDDDQLVELSLETKALIENRLVDEGNESFRSLSTQLLALRQLDVINDSSVRSVLPASSADSESETSARPPSRNLFIDSMEASLESEQDRVPSSATSEHLHEHSRLSDMWLKDYAEFLENWIYADSTDGRKVPSVRKVKVAILGSGFDVNHPFLRGAESNIKETKNWLNKGGSVISDTLGHGTHSLALLLKLAPEADIYVAQVFKDSNPDGLGEVLKAVAQAILYSTTDWKVDIIVLPFGFQNSDEGIDRALKAAFIADVVVLCAASSKGHGYEEMSYPASRASMVISVGATDAMGNSLASNPRVRPRGSFVTLGQNVVSSWPRALPSGDTRYTKRLSGTSISTTIAAGMAATVLHYAWQNLPLMNGNTRYTFRGQEKMSALLGLLSDTVDRDYSYIAPWMLFREGRLQSTIVIRMLERLERLEL